ncbi:pilus assembly protein [Ciceribacter ferrooxidans]|uniref:Pilus assembly protein n=2 Tax=Ciceribacter ferrooxidans TaxID=2509717 RepID=A0A4Q2TA55_9HYPH|nr:pilus assembly protein [Ciceribacter ferrooxidans]
MVVLTMIGYGIYLSAAHAVQQLTSDAARAAVAGITATERSQIASNYISSSADRYSFIDTSAMAVTVNDDPDNPSQFTVTISYDAGNLPIWNLYGFVMPDERITRFATIRLGGL